eukprot:8655281-Pyramimonas_sp.AAC.1
MCSKGHAQHGLELAGPPNAPTKLLTGTPMEPYLSFPSIGRFFRIEYRIPDRVKVCRTRACLGDSTGS